MNAYIHLDQMKVGERAFVACVETPTGGERGGMRRRLLDLGLTPHTEVECVGKSPFGDPAAYRIRGAVVAIRAQDGRSVLLWR